MSKNDSTAVFWIRWIPQLFLDKMNSTVVYWMYTEKKDTSQFQSRQVITQTCKVNSSANIFKSSRTLPYGIELGENVREGYLAFNDDWN